MNYNEMSDYEINKAVGIAKGFPPNTIGHIDHDLKFGAIAEYVTDYCNNQADYMPLAIENNISLILDDVGKAATNNPYEHIEPHGSGERDGFYCEMIDSTNNIGRAICIVYLKMMDSKK